MRQFGMTQQFGRKQALTIAAAALLGVGATAAQAATMTTLDNSDTTWLREGGPAGSEFDNQNYGGSTRFRTQDSNSNDETGLVRFNNLASEVPAGMTIQSATLSLSNYSSGNSGTGATAQVDAHRVLVSWVEGSGDGDSTTGASYNYRDEVNGDAWTSGGGQGLGTDIFATPTDSQTIPDTTGRYEWDVTSDVQMFVAGTADNNGWLFRRSSGSLEPFFGSDEPSGNKPELTLEYAAVPEPASVALFSLSGAMMMLRRRRKA